MGLVLGQGEGCAWCELPGRAGAGLDLACDPQGVELQVGLGLCRRGIGEASAARCSKDFERRQACRFSLGPRGTRGDLFGVPAAGGMRRRRGLQAVAEQADGVAGFGDVDPVETHRSQIPTPNPPIPRPTLRMTLARDLLPAVRQAQAPAAQSMVGADGGMIRAIPHGSRESQMDGALRLPEVDRGDRPRRAQTQSLREELFHPPRVPGTLGSGTSRPTRIAREPENHYAVTDRSFPQGHEFR